MAAARWGARLAAAALIVASVVGCSPPEPDSAGPDVRLLVPSLAGGGYDLTARSAAQVLRRDGIVDDVEVFNVAGSGGIVGLARTVRETGNENLLLVMGLGLVGALNSLPSHYSLSDTTPIARMVEEPEAVLVPAASPYASVRDLQSRWAQDPASVIIGGGSTEGGPDHLLALEIADATGIARTDLDYRRYEGGGDLLPALLTGEVDAATTGISEYLDQIRSGAVRVLAVASRDRSPAVDAPTLREQGIDIALSNWRGFVAPPGVSTSGLDHISRVVHELRTSPRWRQVLERNGWSDAYLPGAEFGAFLAAQNASVARTLRGPDH
ncbi:tripartite tricarboxylate transporter substrate binding protein [Nocardia cyriacigeorgica]|uniref:Tripartite tricarboxylate transporter substrate binding protein n=2 Tax=Nocardia cyriacigeorgica TaxID=135487 RepID=A0ABX0CL68_9NOCA|nr:tripartite tricarboxylate transporter substrate-binding protein [Nocardia cyriacigeorgica]NEW48970.1 tripartite tricarboxylate transporter substrate binding protein [Nocardia cyriacigeorgica]NEW55071.1 tripartite tricarboxylate transporter substrate binding protein [Nocardia cyriacigeorgica]